MKTTPYTTYMDMIQSFSLDPGYFPYITIEYSDRSYAHENGSTEVVSVG